MAGLPAAREKSWPARSTNFGSFRSVGPPTGSESPGGAEPRASPYHRLRSSLIALLSSSARKYELLFAPDLTTTMLCLTTAVPLVRL
jgi:hypothetical protein